MSELDVLRKDIDRLDKEIAELLLSRFAVVKEIGEVKKRDGRSEEHTSELQSPG